MAMPNVAPPSTLAMGLGPVAAPWLDPPPFARIDPTPDPWGRVASGCAIGSSTVGDGCDSADFVAHSRHRSNRWRDAAHMRQACVTPHVARKVRHSAIDARTTRHAGYALSQKRRKKQEDRGTLRLGKDHRWHGPNGAARHRTRPRSLHPDDGSLQSRQIAPAACPLKGANAQQASTAGQSKTASDQPERKTVLPSGLLQQPVRVAPDADYIWLSAAKAMVSGKAEQ